MSRAILHAADFSPASRAAFARAVDMARREHTPLLLAHVMTPPIPIMGDGYVSPATWDAIAKGYRKTSQKKLDALVRKAKARRAGTIVVGTHGRSGVARFFLGSVAGRVVAHAPCPVLTVRGR